MTKDLKAIILKKNKNAPYPNHIIVERKSTSEMAHLYFNNGALSKFVYIRRNPQIQMVWDEKQNRYVSQPRDEYKIERAFSVKGRKYTLIAPKQEGEPLKQTFYGFIMSKNWNEASIVFKNTSVVDGNLTICLDSNSNCKENYIEGCGAEIRVIYPHQERRACPSKNFFAREHS